MGFARCAASFACSACAALACSDGSACPACSACSRSEGALFDSDILHLLTSFARCVPSSSRLGRASDALGRARTRSDALGRARRTLETAHLRPRTSSVGTALEEDRMTPHGPTHQAV